MFSLPPEMLANWLQPGALGWRCGGMGLLIGAFRHLRSDLKGEMKEMKEEMHAGEARTNKRIDEVKEEMKEFKQEMGEIKTLLIQALRLPPPAALSRRGQLPWNKVCGQGGRGGK